MKGWGGVKLTYPDKTIFKDPKLTYPDKTFFKYPSRSWANIIILLIANTHFPECFGWLAQNYAETVPFQKISTLGN